MLAAVVGVLHAIALRVAPWVEGCAPCAHNFHFADTISDTFSRDSFSLYMEWNDTNHFLMIQRELVSRHIMDNSLIPTRFYPNLAWEWVFISDATDKAYFRDPSGPIPTITGVYQDDTNISEIDGLPEFNQYQ